MFYLGVGLATLIGVALGLLGGGGSILTVPILLYVIGVEPHQAIAVSLFVVGSTSTIGAVQHARLGHIDWRIGIAFGLTSMVGAFVGAKLGARLPATLLLVFFATMMLLTAVAMLRKREADQVTPKKRPLALVLIDGVLVGGFTGMVGAGGGFLVVPALALLGGLPIRLAIGTSLMVISLKSFAGFAGYASRVQIPWTVALAVTAAAVLGTFVGTKLSRRWSPQSLRNGFAVFIIAMAIYILVREVFVA